MMTQKEACDHYMPQIEATGRVYEKFTEIEARPATYGEVIVTVTAAGKETTNKADEGDFVVHNMTGAREEYILAGKKLAARYVRLSDLAVAGWCRYQATGSCMAFVYHGSDTEFIATWGEPMKLQTGDMIATPLPEKGEVYRIAAKEFGETYRLSAV